MAAGGPRCSARRCPRQGLAARRPSAALSLWSRGAAARGCGVQRALGAASWGADPRAKGSRELPLSLLC